MAPSPELSAELSLDKLQELLGLALPLCDFMVVDCGVGLNDRSLKIFEQAAGIFVLATPDLSVLRHTRRLVESLQPLQFPAELLKVVANKMPAKGALGPDKMLQVLGRKVMVTLPNEPTVANKAEMEANPFVLGQPRERLSRVYDEFVRKLVEMGALDRMALLARPQGASIGGGRGASLSGDAQQELAAYQKKRGGKVCK